MKTALAFILFTSIVMINGQFLLDDDKDQCQKDSDCRDGCCLKVRGASGSYQWVCATMGVEGSVCDLDGLAEDACPCATGLTCTKIDLSEFGDTAANVNPIFEKYHFGMCEGPGNVAA